MVLLAAEKVRGPGARVMTLKSEEIKVVVWLSAPRYSYAKQASSNL